VNGGRSCPVCSHFPDGGPGRISPSWSCLRLAAGTDETTAGKLGEIVDISVDSGFCCLVLMTALMSILPSCRDQVETP
jgi:hypothetical protein